MMNNLFKLSLGLILGLALLTGANMPGPVGSGGGTKITGAASTIATANLTASRALVSNASGKVEASSVTTNQLGLLGSVAANSIIARPSASPGPPSAVTLSANQFPCRGSSGDVAACSAGSGLSFSGTTLSASAPAWESQTQASNGNSLTLTLSTSGTGYEFFIYIVSNSASSVMDMTLNGSASVYTYYQQYNGSPANGSSTNGYFAAGAAGSGSFSIMKGNVLTNGSTVFGFIDVGTTELGVAQSFIYKTLTAATITSITVNSNQASGIGAGSFIKARRIP